MRVPDSRILGNRERIIEVDLYGCLFKAINIVFNTLASKDFYRL